MWTHASDQELMDVLDGEGAERTSAHVETCQRCRSRLDQARGGLLLARDADVPEPSPLYWESFRRQVGRRIEDEPHAARVPRWRLAPALAMAAIVVGIAALVPTKLGKGTAVATPEAVLPAWTALPAADEDGGLSVIGALAPPADDLSAVAGCQGVECLADLSDDETRALAQALRGELEGGRL